MLFAKNADISFIVLNVITLYVVCVIAHNILRILKKKLNTLLTL